MPRPRFEKLSAEKQTRILEAAAKEFAVHGYEAASLNRILEQAEISKGAAYYYFDDKADLYTTTLHHYLEALWAELPFDIDRFSADHFWSEVTALYQYLFTRYHERPWALGITKAGGPLPAISLLEGPLADLRDSAEGLMAQILKRGRDLGLIRDDLPDDLLQLLVMGVDDAQDRWFYAHRDEMSDADIAAAAHRRTDTLRRLLAPATV